jgi:hypothetical protein
MSLFDSGGDSKREIGKLRYKEDSGEVINIAVVQAYKKEKSRTRYILRRKKMRLTTCQEKYTTYYSPEGYENITLSSLPNKMLLRTRNKGRMKKINETVDQKRKMTVTQNCKKR